MELFSSLSTAGTRTKTALFSPFEIGKWFVLGFTAWLANFLTGTNPGGGSFPVEQFIPDSKSSDTSSISPASDFFATCWHTITSKVTSSGVVADGVAGAAPPSVGLVGSSIPSLPDLDTTTWILIGGAAVIAFCAIVLVLLWLGCRGWFMFLDNVIHNRAWVKVPWREFKTHANSLFWFYIGLSTVMVLAMIVFAVPAYFAFPKGSGHDWTAYIPLIILGSVFLLFIVGLAFISFFTLEFGTLWMYRHGGSAWAAMWKVSELATQYPLPFIGYAVIRFVMTILIMLCGFLLGCLTCCLGFFPYLNAVLNLPLSVYRNWYAIECFANLGPEYDVRVPAVPVLPPSVS